MGGPKNEAKLPGSSAPEGPHPSTRTSFKISLPVPGYGAPTTGESHRAPEVRTAWHQEPDSPLPQAAGPTTSPLSLPGFCWNNQPSARGWDLEGTQPSRVPVWCPHKDRLSAKQSVVPQPSRETGGPGRGQLVGLLSTHQQMAVASQGGALAGTPKGVSDLVGVAGEVCCRQPGITRGCVQELIGHPRPSSAGAEPPFQCFIHPQPSPPTYPQGAAHHHLPSRRGCHGGHKPDRTPVEGANQDRDGSQRAPGLSLPEFPLKTSHLLVFSPNFRVSFVGKTNRYLCLISLKTEVRKHSGAKSAGKDQFN